MFANLSNKLQSFPIQHMVWASFALVLASLLFSNIANITSLSTVHDTVDYVLDEVQPTLLLSRKLESSIGRASNALNSYLLNQEEYHAQAYEESTSEIQVIISSLKTSTKKSGDKESQKLIDAVEQDINSFLGFKARLFELANTPADNYPALQFSAENINPISQSILQNLVQMLLTEADEEISPERKALLTDINELRYTWVRLMSGVRAFLAFRGQGSLVEIELYGENANNLVQKINEQGELLTFDQEDSLEQVTQHISTFHKNLNEMIGLHGGEQWRTDVYVLRTDLQPLLLSINNNLDKLDTINSSSGIKIQEMMCRLSLVIYPTSHGFRPFWRPASRL